MMILKKGRLMTILVNRSWHFECSSADHYLLHNDDQSIISLFRVELRASLMLVTRRLAGHLGWFIIIKKHCMVGWLNSQSTVSDLSIPRFGDLSGPTVAYSPPSHYSLGAPPTLKDPMETVTVEVGSILSNSKEKLKSLNEPLKFSSVSSQNYLKKLFEII